MALNRAVAIGFAHGPQAGLDALDQLTDDPQLATYAYLAAARTDFLHRLGRTDDARTAYTEALLPTGNTVERPFLASRLDDLGPGRPAPRNPDTPPSQTTCLPRSGEDRRCRPCAVLGWNDRRVSEWVFFMHPHRRGLLRGWDRQPRRQA